MMPEPISAQDFAGPHPTCRDLVARLVEWGFTKRRTENVHTLFRGPHGGTLRVIRSELGRADLAVAEKAARLAGVTAAQFWVGPGAPPAAQLRRASRPAGPALRERAARDTVISVVLSVHAAADRPLGFDQVAELSDGRVTRAQASAASAALCRGGQLDRIRSGVYQWSAGRRAAVRQVPAPRPDGAPLPAAGPVEGASAAGVFGQLFPSGVRMTAELLADLEQWARLTGKLAAKGGAARELPSPARGRQLT